MQTSIWLKIRLYCVSLIPLMIIVSVSKSVNIYSLGPSWQNGVFCAWSKIVFDPLLLVAISHLAVSLFFLYRFQFLLAGTTKLPLKVVKISSVNYEYLTFFATYIIPLVTLDISQIQNAVVLFLLLLLIGMIFMRTNLFYANPTLALFGFQLFKVDTGSLSDQIVISKENIEINNYIAFIDLGSGILYARKMEKVSI